MTNYNGRLDEILERYRLFANMAYSEVEDGFRTADEFKDLALPKVLAEAKQAILDWHHKQVEVVLDRIESGSFGIKQDIGVSQYPARSVYEPEHIAAIHKVVPLSAVEAERNKLKEAEL